MKYFRGIEAFSQCTVVKMQGCQFKFLMNYIQKIPNALQKSIQITMRAGVELKRTYDSKRSAISEPKQILDVMSCLLSGILCKQYTYLFTKK